MAFWKKFYKSKYTGAEIDTAMAKAGDATKVTANPTLAGTEAALTGLEVGTTKYKVEQPINVVANPTLTGTEAALEGLQVGNTKYKVEGFTEPSIELTAIESGVILTPLMPVFAAVGDTLTGYRGSIVTGTDTIIAKMLPYCDGSYNRIKVTFTGLDGFFYMKLISLNSEYAAFDSDFYYYKPVGGTDCLFKLGISIPLTEQGQLNVALYVQKVNLAT